MLPDLLLTSQRVVTPEGVRPATVHVLNGKIERVGPIEVQSGVPAIDCGDSVLMAGIVDTHVHINQPGRSEWEGSGMATRAAAAGGITALVDMPLNSIPATVTRRGLRRKKEVAFGRCFVDLALCGGVVPGNTVDLAKLLSECVRGFKCIL
jgi:allantoinase